MSENDLIAAISDITARMERMIWTGGVGGPEWLALHEEREVARREFWEPYKARARAHKVAREPVVFTFKRRSIAAPDGRCAP